MTRTKVLESRAKQPLSADDPPHEPEASVTSGGYETVLRFARALDNEDYADARSNLSDTCTYACRGECYRGPQAIIASYQGNGTAAKAFDSIRYESHVAAEATGTFRISFVDHIAQAGRHLSFRCEQLIALDESGRIVSIEHLDLPGQVEALAEFRELLTGRRDERG